MLHILTEKLLEIIKNHIIQQLKHYEQKYVHELSRLCFFSYSFFNQPIKNKNMHLYSSKYFSNKNELKNKHII